MKERTESTNDQESIFDDATVKSMLVESLLEQGLTAESVTDEMVAEFKAELLDLQDSTSAPPAPTPELDLELEFDPDTDLELEFELEPEPKQERQEPKRKGRARPSRKTPQIERHSPIVSPSGNGGIMRIIIGFGVFLVVLIGAGLFVLTKLQDEPTSPSRPASVQPPKEITTVKADPAPVVNTEVKDPLREPRIMQDSKGLVMHLTFDSKEDPFADARKNFKVVPVKGVGLKRGFKGKGAYFNKSGYLEIPHRREMSWRRVTIALWVKFSTDDEGQSVISKHSQSHSANGFNLLLHRKKMIAQVKGKKNSFTLDETRPVEAGKWRHVVMTLQSGGYSGLFVNGILNEETIIPLWRNTEPLRIGRSIDGYWKPFFGIVDDVRLYTRILSKKEIETLYHGSLSPRPHKPKFAWTFSRRKVDEFQIKPTAGELSAITRKRPVIKTYGKIDALELADDNSLSVFEGDGHGGLPTKFLTVETWVRIDKETKWGGIVSAFQDNGNYERGWLLGFRNDTFTFAVKSKTTKSLTYLNATTSFSKGTWYHVVGRYDGTSQTLFVNGVKSIESNTQNGDIDYAPKNFFDIGCYHDDDELYPMTGAIRSVRIFDQPLSDAMIYKHYLAGRNVFKK